MLREKFTSFVRLISVWSHSNEDLVKEPDMWLNKAENACASKFHEHNKHLVILYIVLSQTSCNAPSPNPLSPYKETYNGINPISCGGRSLLQFKKILIKIQKMKVDSTQDGSPWLQGMDLHHHSLCHSLAMYPCMPIVPIRYDCLSNRDEYCPEFIP